MITMRAIRKLFSLLLMLALPLQGLAALASTAPCGDEHAAMSGNALHSAPAPVHSEAHDNHHVSHTPEHGPGHDGGASNGHSCCHHVFTGVPPVVSPTAPEAPNAVTPRVSLLATLFIPELPQRPPRA